MFVSLLPDQVTKNWDAIKITIANSVPEVPGESVEKLNNILRAMLVGKMLCWISYDVVDDKSIINAVMLTRILTDDITETQSVLIYSINAQVQTTEAQWVEGFSVLSTYAKSQGCSRIVTYSHSDDIDKIAAKFGGVSEFRYISFDL